MAIVGVGLIGGSIGLALRERKLAREVIGIGRRSETLRVAKRRGAVTQTTTELELGVARAGLVILCTPVESIVDLVRRISRVCPQRALITDAGSTKEEIVLSVDRELSQANPGEVSFVGSHPMAGSEKAGPRHARADLFESCVAIVTPSNQTNPVACRSVERLWKSLGAKTIRMAPREHDQAVAAISHMPHVVASVLASGTPPSALPLAAGGWRDTTRVASGDPQLWRQILTQNRHNVLECLNEFSRNLDAMRRALKDKDGDELAVLLEKGKAVRDACGTDNSRKNRQSSLEGDSQ